MNANILQFCFVIIIFIGCEGQIDPYFPISIRSLEQIRRSTMGVPKGRSASLDNIIIKLYSTNTSKNSSYQMNEVTRLLADPEYDVRRPTVCYAHGYIELTEDESVTTVVEAYRRNGRYNILILDWSNVAFGNYVLVAMDLRPASDRVSKAFIQLLKAGMRLEGLHFVGHSLGAHLMGGVAKSLSSKGFIVPRLTGLDAAYPGFYPPILSSPTSRSDAAFVDLIHTDGGRYGIPQSSGHVDFWPNGGIAKQPGCLPTSVFFTDEDFCSHFRSWQYWCEAVAGEKYWARGCNSYDEFLRGQCTGGKVLMGPDTDLRIRGNFYLRTAAVKPFSLGMRGID